MNTNEKPRIAFMAELHPAFHMRVGTPNLIKTLCSGENHPFSVIVATDHKGPNPVAGPWDSIPTLSLFRPRSLLPVSIGLGLLDPLAFKLQQQRVIKFLKKHQIERIFVLVANNARFTTFVTQLPTDLPMDIYIIDDFVADSMIYKVSREKAQQTLGKLVKESHRVFTISPVYAEDLENEFRRKCEFLPIPIPDAMFHFHTLTANSIEPELKRKKSRSSKKQITLHHAGQIHHLYADAMAQLVSVLQKIAENHKTKISLELWGSLDINKVQRALKLNLEDVGENSASYFKIKLCGEAHAQEFVRAQKRADFLLLVNSFNTELQRQIRCSFSSKVCEYMLSGVPIILYAPPYSSLVSHLEKHDAAHIITTKDDDMVQTQMEKILFKDERRRKAKAASALAHDLHTCRALYDRIVEGI